MRNLLPLTRREMAAVFYSPMAYVVTAVFLILIGVFFPYLTDATASASNMTDVIWNKPADWAAHQTLDLVQTLLILIAPFLTIRLIAEEQRSGSIELLMTAPVTDAEVVVSKWLGVCVFFLFMLAFTAVPMGILFHYGAPDPYRLAAHYLGVLLLAGMFLAVGVFCSALTRNQIVAGLFCIGLILGLALINSVDAYVGGGVGRFCRQMSPYSLLAQMGRGHVTSHQIVYFVSMTLFWLFVATRVLESRKWR